MNKIILVSLMLVISLFLIVGCAKQTEVSDGTEVADDGALAGEVSRLPIRPTEGVVKNDFFILKMDASQNEILQYKGADKSTATSPRIKFKLISSGETLEYALTGGSAIVRLGGKSYQIQLTRPDKIDSPINVDYDGDGTLDTVHKKSTLHSKELMDLAGVYYIEPVTCTEVKTLLEGESVAVESMGISNLVLTFVNAEQARVSIDGTASSGGIALGRGTQVTSGAYVHVLGILYQDYAGGIHQATLCLR
ncbi:hypothetical protein J4437_01550 [Candidatus Woesearchaeota archaeon]|nr:hypothetical protein [Candidatus Woesearchaeota archaeon]